jgi:hypothetical protein
VWERARFNRYYPAMKGKRRYGVIWKYVCATLEGVKANGVPLTERFFMPEPFDRGNKAEIMARRRQTFSRLHRADDTVPRPMMIFMGEYKGCETTPYGRKVWMKYMPERPLFVDDKVWAHIERVYGPMYQARASETPPRTRIIACALVHARRETVYQIETAAFMRVTADNWIPVDGLHELELVQALTEQGRAFYKPLPYDTRRGDGFATALLLDTGDKPTPLYVVGREEKERAAKQESRVSLPAHVWVWHTDPPMPALPPAALARRAGGAPS